MWHRVHEGGMVHGCSRGCGVRQQGRAQEEAMAQGRRECPLAAVVWEDNGPRVWCGAWCVAMGMTRGVSMTQGASTGCACVGRGVAPGCGMGHVGDLPTLWVCKSRAFAHKN